MGFVRSLWHLRLYLSFSYPLSQSVACVLCIVVSAYFGAFLFTHIQLSDLVSVLKWPYLAPVSTVYFYMMILNSISLISGWLLQEIRWQYFKQEGQLMQWLISEYYWDLQSAFHLSKKCQIWLILQWSAIRHQIKQNRYINDCYKFGVIF